MKQMMKRILSAVLALGLLLSGVSLAEPATAAAPVVYSHNGRVTLIDGATTDAAVNDFNSASAVVSGALAQLGGDDRTQLEPWRTLTDAYGNRYYVFQQMADHTTVLGGAVKVITDGNGRMLGLTSSIVSDLPKTAGSEGIPAEKAEEIVLTHAQETQQQTLTLIGGHTDTMILPKALNLDVEEDPDETSRYVWVVYTDNPESTRSLTSHLPYLAHYVTLEGEYLYSLPTIMPGDEAGASGFDTSYVFEFMEPVDYTGYVDLSTGGEQEISVTVMRDKRTGMYYLGNLERRIVVADCWEFLYNEGRVVLEYSPDNLEWDQTGLLTLYNYCRAYDYYKAIGWSGGDGLDTPILILNNFCTIDHKPVDNAAYVGNFLGWQIFLSSQANDLAQCLDVLTHEFTHCVTSSVMTYNAYMNDYGAINEAMSDIQGKTCQMLMEGPENTTWELGDRSLMKVRSMDEPHRYQQPEFTWDVYYVPTVKTPTVLNDEGGVHSNSSLLNYLAWQLYEKAGMTMEEGRAFWFTVDCAMVPGTDYAQLSELLPWALRAAGLEKYDIDLRRSLDVTRLGVEKLPDTFDADHALLTLTLPENKVFDDEQWILYVFSVDVDKLIDTVMHIVGSVIAGDYSVLPPFLQEAIAQGEEAADQTEVSQEVSQAEPEQTEVAQPEADQPEATGADGGLLTELLSLFAGGEATDVAEVEPAEGEADQQDQEVMNQIYEELAVWAGELLKDVFYISSTNAGQDGRTMRMVCLPGHAVPVLLHGVYNSDTNDLDDSCVLVYIGGTWVDLGALEDMPAEPTEDVELSEGMQAFVEGIFQAGGLNDILDLIFYPIRGGENNVLPADGLDVMQPAQSSMFKSPEEDAADLPQPKKSRPKLEPAPEALPEAEATAEPAEAAAEEPVPEATAEPAEEPVAEPAEDPVAKPAQP